MPSTDVTPRNHQPRAITLPNSVCQCRAQKKSFSLTEKGIGAPCSPDTPTPLTEMKMGFRVTPEGNLNFYSG
jgi:hypothetical protein